MPLKGQMILSCVEKSNFLLMSLYNRYCCPLTNIYSCNDNYLQKPEKKYSLDLEYSGICLVTSLKVYGSCAYDYGESPVYIPPKH